MIYQNTSKTTCEYTCKAQRVVLQDADLYKSFVFFFFFKYIPCLSPSNIHNEIYRVYEQKSDRFLKNSFI